jgi:hypothetical protein
MSFLVRLQSNVEELVQFVNFLEPRKSVFSHGDDMTKVAELQRRLTGRVLEYIPENRLIEYWVPVEMTPVQLDQYYNLLVRHYPTLSGNNRDHQIQEVVIKLRQVHCDPLFCVIYMRTCHALFNVSSCIFKNILTYCRLKVEKQL